MLLPGGAVLFQIRELSIRPGEHILIQGPSGGGKTTLLHTLAGLIAPAKGKVKADQQDLYAWSETRRALWRRHSVGIIFQKLNLLGHLTVYENVALSQGQRITESLGQVNMGGRASTRAEVLSLGEQQRVAVARVLAQGPALTLADEPTSSLDAVNQKFVIEALTESSRGRTLIVASHDERLVPYFDRVLTMAEITA